MNSIFNLNNPLYQLVGKLMKLVWLNVLWIITSIPIITIGASTTALYYVTLKLVRNQEGNITKDYFHSFGMNLKQSTIVFLIMSTLFGISFFNFLVLSHSTSGSYKLLSMLILGFLFIYLMIAVYLLPLIAQFNTKTFSVFKTAFTISITNIHWSFCLVVLGLALPLLILFRLLPLIVLGYPLVVFVQSYILNRVFQQYVPDKNWQDGTLATLDHT